MAECDVKMPEDFLLKLSRLGSNMDSVAETELTRYIDRQMFYPVPNVDSAVITAKFVGNRVGVQDFAEFRQITKCAFAQRRKTLANNLISFFGVDRQRAENWLINNGIDVKCRGETLSAQQFATLANSLKELKK